MTGLRATGRRALGTARARLRRARSRSRGQGLVEFSLILPVFILLLIGMFEFGFVFEHNIALSYSTREGARVGSALADGGGTVPCTIVGENQAPDYAAGVDPLVIAAVQRVVTSPGSLIVPSRIEEITIYKANAQGDPTGSLINRWTYSPGGGPMVEGRRLDFANASTNWSACTRDNGSVPDSLGVGVRYRYELQTALGPIMRFFGGSFAATLPMSDRTVMALNPTD